MGRRGIGVLVGLGLTLCGCQGSSTSASVTTDPVAPTTIPRTTTTTSIPDFSFDDSVPPPELINTGTNYVAILKSLGQYSNWLAAHRPDPALTSRVVAQGTKLHDDFARDLTRLRDNGKREIEKVGRRPSQYTIVSSTPNAFSAHVVEDIVARLTVDTTGKVTSHVRFASQTTYLMVAVLSRGHWSLASVDVQHRQAVRW